MPKKRSILLHKVSNLLKISILLAKMRKPIIPILVSLKKSSKLNKLRYLKRKHYKYGFGYIKEYEFSPSNTPLIHYYRKPIKKKNYRDFYSISFLGKCLGKLNIRGAEGTYSYPLELMALPAIEHEEVAGGGEVLELSDSDSEGDSVDERAERFIEKFYQEMRLQRQESLLQQFNGIMDID